MTEVSTAERVKRIVLENACIDTLVDTPEAPMSAIPLSDFGMDSLDIQDLIFDLETVLHVSLDETSITNRTTIGEIVAMCEERVKETA